MRRIVVLGCGFGGFKAASELERSLARRRRVQVTVVSDRSHFVYTPLLPGVATGELDASHITFPLQSAFDKSTEVIVEPIEAIDVHTRTLRGQRSAIDFDYLVVACGSEVDWGGHPDWESHALVCKSARDAVHVRETLRTALREAATMTSAEQRARRLTFVVAGAGPTGVSMAAELLSALKLEAANLADDDIGRALRVVLVEQRDAILPDFPADLGQLARTHLRELGMEVRLGTAVVGRTANEVELSTGEVITADHLLWCGGVRPPRLVRESGFELDARGRLRVDDTLQVRAHPGIYAVGDVAGAGAEVPQNAQVATQQAAEAARNIIAELSGRARRGWHYKHRGDLIPLGPEHAVGMLGESAIDGRAARTLYRLIHTALMPNGVKKAQLLTDWLFTSRRRRANSRHLLAGAPPAPQLEGDDSDS